ncbi:HNH endonuclease [Arthrobacter phage Tuck]|uniref:HNH endonuclease n=2 Tax=Yangvirus TaxID=2733221 RepID=A0A9E8M9J3_9CAUD|nr:endonuclease VII [Arthrobacter phage Phives]QOP65195.1 hypothetical protein SEA_PHIVES_68 [Arthrobacter phage Phives]WAB10841.1 HNH endonuclease [Arthrobacter phage Tuck]
MTCCEECAYPGNPGVCVKAGTCPCHDVEEDPVSRISRVAASYDSGNGEAQALTAQALARLAYRRRHSGKTCDRCRETKPLSAFSKDVSRPDGLMRYCRACRSAAYRAGLV